MIALLEELKSEYEQKFVSYCKIAEISKEAGDEETFRGMLKKASGCKLMIDAYEKQISDFKGRECK